MKRFFAIQLCCKIARLFLGARTKDPQRQGEAVNLYDITARCRAHGYDGWSEYAGDEWEYRTRGDTELRKVFG